MMAWRHACWVRALDKAGDAPLCVYAQWIEASAEEIAAYLADRPLPGACRAAKAAGRRNKKEELDRKQGLWLRWVRRNAEPIGPAGEREARFAIVDNIQIGADPALLANGFSIPAHLGNVRLATSQRSGKAGKGAARPQGFLGILEEQMSRWWQDPAYVPAFSCAPARTEFQQRALSGISKVACGQTATYMDIARKIASAPRAVGQACRRNHLPIVIPCHRIVGSHSQGGYLGHAVDDSREADDLKRALLKREGIAG